MFCASKILTAKSLPQDLEPTLSLSSNPQGKVPMSIRRYMSHRILYLLHTRRDGEVAHFRNYDI